MVSSCEPSLRGWVMRSLVLGAALLLGLTSLDGLCSDKWTATGSLPSTQITEYPVHHAVLLGTGKILVCGGRDGSGVSVKCHLYDPGSGKWAATGSLKVARRDQPILLADGRVLMTGNSATCEIYNPKAGTWSVVASMNVARTAFAASLLADGRVLVSGGLNGGFLNTAEVYDVKADTWKLVGKLNQARSHHTQTTLGDGRVLITGGDASGGATARCEILIPSKGLWAFTDSLAAARRNHSAVRLKDGRVLVAGGGPDTASANISSELFNFKTDLWDGPVKVGSGAHLNAAMVRMNDNRVLLIGGRESLGGASTAACALFDPLSGSWTATANLQVARSNAFASVLPGEDLRVLVAGGLVGLKMASSSELFVPESIPVIKSLTPGGGPTSGGTTVSIVGSGFDFNTTVVFGGAAASSIKVNSATELVCQSPAHAAGLVDVAVFNASKKGSSLADAFNYDDENTAPQLDSGPSSSAQSPLEGEEITFTVPASDPDGDDLKISWDFGDGSSGSGDSVVHAFAAAGTYTVTVTVSDGSTSVSDSLSQMVFSPTAPNITTGPTASPNPAVVDNAVLLTAAGSNAAGDPITLSWDFGDGTPGETGDSVKHTFAATGDYTVVVTATDPAGNSSSKSLILTVGDTGLTTGTMALLKVRLKLNFKKDNTDLLVVQGIMEIPEGFNPEGATVDVDCTGAFGSFVLDAKGKARTDKNGDVNKRFAIKLKFKKGVLVPGGSKFVLTFKKGDFKETWAPFGLVNANVGPEEVSIPMSITVASSIFPDFLNGSYRASEGKTGQYLGKESLLLTGF